MMSVDIQVSFEAVPKNTEAPVPSVLPANVSRPLLLPVEAPVEALAVRNRAFKISRIHLYIGESRVNSCIAISLYTATGDFGISIVSRHQPWA